MHASSAFRCRAVPRAGERILERAALQFADALVDLAQAAVDAAHQQAQFVLAILRQFRQALLALVGLDDPRHQPQRRQEV
jgi:hypothetical protein